MNRAVVAWGQVADPFHVIRLANHSIDEVRRRTQNDTLGHRGRKDDPLYRARRLLIAAHERLSERGDAKLRGLLAAGDPRGEVRLAWHAKETLRGLYDIDCAQHRQHHLQLPLRTPLGRFGHQHLLASDPTKT